MWSTVEDQKIIRFTRESGEKIPSGARESQPVICISTYSMVAHQGKRSYEADQMMKWLQKQEWGLIVLDGK